LIQLLSVKLKTVLPSFDHASDGDESLRKEVESLRASFDEGESFM
jgi:hypothetical protein